MYFAFLLWGTSAGWSEQITGFFFAYTGRSNLPQVIVSVTIFLIIQCAPLKAKIPQQIFIKASKKKIYSYSNVLLPCNSPLISNDVSGHQILSELGKVNLLDYLPVQGFVHSVLLDS